MQSEFCGEGRQRDKCKYPHFHINTVGDTASKPASSLVTLADRGISLRILNVQE